MKPLKIKWGFLHSIFGLQLLLVSDTVSAADDDTMVEDLLKELGYDNNAGIIESNPPDNGNNPNQVAGDDSMNAGLEEWMRELNNPDDPNQGTVGDVDIDGVDIDKLLADFANEHRVENMFVWPDGVSSCFEKKREMGRGLEEAVTLAETAILNLEIAMEEKPWKHVKYPEIFTKNNAAFTAQFWGISWFYSDKKENINIQFKGKEALKQPKAKYQDILELLIADRPSPVNRVRSICGDKNIKMFERAGKYYWRVEDVGLDIEQPVHDEGPFESPCAKSDTLVLPGNNLILFCDSVWTKNEVTLKSMIEDHESYDKDHQLDDMSTLGGVMLHVLSHVFEIAADIMVEGEYQPTVAGSRRFIIGSGWSETSTTNYYKCATLGKKDFIQRTDIEFDKSVEDSKKYVLLSPRNAASIVWYATSVVLYRVPWWDRAGLPVYFGAHAWRKKQKELANEQLNQPSVRK